MMTDSETAISLMKMALALFDRAGEAASAAALQQAISVAGDEAIPLTIEQADALLDIPEARCLIDRMSERQGLAGLS